LLTIGQRNTFHVTATVNSCVSLTNIAQAYWTIGNEPNRDGITLGMSGDPVSDTTDVAYLLETPDVSVTASGDFDIDYCATPAGQTIVVTASNAAGAGAAAKFVLASNMDGSYTVGPVDSNWTYNAGNGEFTLVANGGVLTAGNTMTLSFVVTPTVNVCGGDFSRDISFEAQYSNGCNLDYTGPSANVTYSYAQVGSLQPALSVDKTVDDGVSYTGDTAVFTISFTAENIENLVSPIIITDNIPSSFSNTAILAGSPSVGSGSIVGNQLVWTITTTSGNLSGTLSFSVTVVDDAGVCGANSTVSNVVDAFAETTCAACGPLTDTASVEVIIQNSPIGEPGGGVSSHTEVCGNDFTITNTYQISIATWSGIIFTDTLGTRDVPDDSLTYVGGTLSVTVNGIPVTPAIVQTSPQLVVDLSGISAPTGTITVTISYDIDPDEDFLENQAQQRIFNWSEFHVPGSGSGACTGNDTFYQGVWIDLQRADLQINISPQSFDGCRTVPVTLTVSDPDFVSQGLTATNVAVTFQAAPSELATIDTGAMTYDGGFTGGPTFGPTLSGTNTLVWTFTNGLASNEYTGTISFAMQRGCNSAPLSSTVTFDDRCGITHGNSGGVAQSPRLPDLVLFVTPDTYMVNEKTARWRAYVTNIGDATAVTATITNTFGAGFQFISNTTNMPGNLTLLNTSPFTIGEDIMWQITNLAPGEQIRIDIYARVVSCGDVEAAVKLKSECLGFQCSSPQEKTLTFIQPTPDIRSSNDQTADLPLCSTGEVLLRVKNASASSHIYNMTISETLTSLGYVAGSSYMTVTDRHGNPIAGMINIPFEPVTSPVVGGTLLRWGWDIMSDTINVTQTRILTDRGPEESINIRFTVQTDCGTPGENKVQATAAGEEPCGNFFFRDESAETLETIDPDITISKEGRNATKGSGFAETVYGEPGDTIVWRVRVYNAIGAYIAQNVVITDILPSDVFLISSDVSSGTTSTVNSDVVWDLGNLPADGQHQTLTLTTVITVPNDVCNINSINRARFDYGCNDGCKMTPDQEAIATLIKRPNINIEVPGSVNLNVCGDVLTITLNNTPVISAYNVYLTDTLPAGYEYVNGAAPGATISPTAGTTETLEWYWPVLPPGNITWTVTVSNLGAGAAYGVVVTDVAGTQYSNLSHISNTTGVTANINGNVITWNVGSVITGNPWSAILTATLNATGTNANDVGVTSLCDTGCQTSEYSDTAYVSLLNVFSKTPKIQTGTIGSLVIFDLAATMSDENDDYKNIVRG